MTTVPACLVCAWVLLPVSAAAQVSVFGFQQHTTGSNIPATGQNVPGRGADPVPVSMTTTEDVRFGVAVTWTLTPTLAVEGVWQRHAFDVIVGEGNNQTELPVDLRATHYIAHLLYHFDPVKRWRPFVFAGAGVTALRSSVTGIEHHGVADVGGGVLTQLTKKFGFRSQARLAPMPGTHATGREVYGRGNTGQYAIEPTQSAVAFEVQVGVTFTF